MSSDGPATTYLVESYWPGISASALAAAAQRTRSAAAALRRRGSDVDLVGWIFVPTDETVFWLFGGRESDVRSASEQAGVPFARVLESRHELGNHTDDKEGGR
jgi:hypothetical protein